jgi:hypothetical protein
MPHSIEDVVSKIKWADNHIQHFRTAAVEFMRKNPYSVVVEVDPNVGNKIYNLTKVTPIPPNIRLIAGDAIQNMRSALDYLACGLVRVATKAEPSKYVGFPISDSMPTSREEKAAFARQVKGMRKEAIDAIKAIKPYKGGDDTLWRLHRLNIIDKHRLLMAAGTCVTLVDPRFMTKLRDYLITGNEPLPGVTRPLKNWFPLKAGDKFSLNIMNTKVELNEEPFFEIALNEPGIAEGEVVISVLKQSLRSVQEVVGNLTRFM